MVTEVYDTYQISDSDDIVTVNDQADIITIVESAEGAIIVTDSQDNYTVADGIDKVAVSDAVDAYEVTDPTVVNNITVNKPVALARISPVAGENIGKYKMVALSSGLAVHCDNTISAHSRSTLGISEEATSQGFAASIVTAGEVINIGWSLTVDAPVYASTSGDITQVVPTTGFLLKIGIALSATSISVDIDLPIHLH